MQMEKKTADIRALNDHWALFIMSHAPKMFVAHAPWLFMQHRMPNQRKGLKYCVMKGLGVQMTKG